MNGIIVLDKPEGLSSAQALAKVKRLMGARKAGHAGTLDPFATGLLICCIGQATRLARFFVQGLKTYDALLHLGVTTDTQDVTGRVTGRVAVPELDWSASERILKEFQGPQMQQPPVFAALKHQGTPLYELARQGRPVQKPPRPVMISAMRLQEVGLPQVRFTVTCSAGTYIRSLCADIGQRIGCGGHLAKLRRIECGGFSLADAVTLEELATLPCAERTDRLIPMGIALRQMPVVVADSPLLEHMGQGRSLDSVELPVEPADRFVKVVDRQGQLKAVLEKSPGDGYIYCCVFT